MQPNNPDPRSRREKEGLGQVRTTWDERVEKGGPVAKRSFESRPPFSARGGGGLEHEGRSAPKGVQTDLKSLMQTPDLNARGGGLERENAH